MTPFSVVYKAFLRQITDDMYMEFTEQDTQKMFFAINRIDQTDEDDLREAIEHNLNILETYETQ